MALIRVKIAATAAAISVLLPSAAMAADGYWLDQYNALLFMGLFRLDAELEEMKQKGAAVVMVHADSLPDPLLRWIAWRANRVKLKPVAWIQRPTADNLTRVSKVSGYKALQVDDHFFAKPPLEIGKLRSLLSDRQLWCSFQPGQYNWRAARLCDHVDIQLYRITCNSTIDAAYRLGVAGRRDTAIAVYHDGSEADDRRLNCFRESFQNIGNRVFVFKWKNPEYWLTPYTRVFWQTLSRLVSGAPVSKP
jgi:hypothetical protein